MSEYILTITTNAAIPEEVVREAVERAVLRLIRKPAPTPTASVKIVAKNVDNRLHPFDGPEVFDDVVTEHTPQDVVDAVFRAIGEDFPRLKELFTVKRSTRVTEPPAEGDWELPEEDHVGED